MESITATMLSRILSYFASSKHNSLPPASLQEYIELLHRKGELHIIDTPVSPYLEIAEISRRVVAEEGPALLFRNVKGSRFPVATNLYGSKKRLELAFGDDVEERVGSYVKLLTEEFPPTFKTLYSRKNDLFALSRIRCKNTNWKSLKQHRVDEITLDDLPLLTSWKEDGGAFVTLPLVYTQSMKKPSSRNLGMYRIQRYDKNTTGLHWQIGKGGGFHFYEAEQVNKDLPVAVFIGGPPALTLAAIAPLPENVPELLFASFLLKRPLEMTNTPYHPYSIPHHSDFALLGYAKAHERRIEGPFGDHFGYLSLAHEFPVFHCKHIVHKEGAILPATVVGPPPQEDLYIGEFLQKLLSPLFPVVMPAVEHLHTYPESGFHALAAMQVKERYEKESLSTALRVMGEGQLALTKILFAIGQKDISLEDFSSVFQNLLERIRPEEDIIILSHTANDTLDYTGPKLNRGSKAIFMGVVKEPRRILPRSKPQSMPNYVKEAHIFCPGCLVITVSSTCPQPQAIVDHEAFHEWPCIVITDDATSTVSSDRQFLWQVFTRFEPAQDLYFKQSFLRRNSAGFSFPMLIDSRMKPHYPPALICDDETSKLVDSRWKEYFPT